MARSITARPIIDGEGAYGAGAYGAGAYGAVRPLGPVFFANFSEMADLSGKRHAYSWMK